MPGRSARSVNPLAQPSQVRILLPPSRFTGEAGGLGRLRAKAEPIVFHDLRHTFGTQCAAKGIDLRRIQAWMGHANIATTMRYLHYVPQHDDAARLTEAFATASSDALTSTPVSV